MRITANPITREVTVNGDQLDPKKSQRIMNHSPDGFSWGYNGSGPAQLALALTLEAAHIMNVPFGQVKKYYQEIKSKFVSKWPIDEAVDGDYYIEEYLKSIISKEKSTDEKEDKDVSQKKAYDQGFIDGMTCFAHWKDGCQYVGSSGQSLSAATYHRQSLWNYNAKMKVDE